MGFCNKSVLFIINFIVCVFGILVVGLASFIIHKNNEYGSLLLEGTFTVPIVILIAGIIILITGFLGCCGALNENTCMLKTYAGIVLVCLIAEITLGILILLNNNKFGEILKEQMGKRLNKYGGKDEALTNSIDLIQHEAHCCGVNNYTDYFNYTHTKPSSVAKGCCKDMVDECGEDIKGKGDLDTLIYTEGCYEVLTGNITKVTTWLGVACIILAVVQVLTIALACSIANSKQAQYNA